MQVIHTKVSQSIVLINLGKSELILTASSVAFARKSVSGCDIYVSINISHSLTDFRAKEGLLEV